MLNFRHSVQEKANFSEKVDSKYSRRARQRIRI